MVWGDIGGTRPRKGYTALCVGYSICSKRSCTKCPSYLAVFVGLLLGSAGSAALLQLIDLPLQSCVDLHGFNLRLGGSQVNR